MTSDRTVDCTGLFCPMPIVRTKQEITDLQPGQVLEVLADDPGFVNDLPAWCTMMGHKFLGIEQEGHLYKGYVQKV